MAILKSLFLGRFLSIPGWLWLLVIAAAVTFFARGAFDSALETAADTGREAGTAEARADAAEASLEQTEKANAARDKVRRDSAAARSDCLRDARNPTDC